jgi:hypothetical protein
MRGTSMYEIRDSAFNVIDTAAQLVDGAEVPEWRRADAMTKGRLLGEQGVTCIAVNAAGEAVAGFGCRPGLLLHRWRSGMAGSGGERAVA